MPRIAMNSASGTRPAGGGPFRASVNAQTMMSRTAVPMNCARRVSVYPPGNESLINKPYVTSPSSSRSY